MNFAPRQSLAAALQSPKRAVVFNSTMTLGAMEKVAKDATAIALRGDIERAEALFRRVLRAAPSYPPAHGNLGIHYQAVGRHEEAVRYLDRALELTPPGCEFWDAEFRRARGFARLAQGYYDANAWKDVECRFHVGPEALPVSKPPVNRPEWNGNLLPGQRLLIMPEQGLGDQIQMARFAPWLRKRGLKVTLVCRPELARLFRGLGVKVWEHKGLDGPASDCWVSDMSIPQRIGLTVETIPNASYLPAPWRMGTRRARIGVAARGNPNHINDGNRSLSAAAAARLNSLPRAMSLLPEDSGARDFRDTAEIIAGLDLVITVDTSIAHLAGAMGKPVWILLPAYATDWRWMRGRSDSPWYPSAKLYRQPGIGDWNSVIDQVEADIHQGRELG